MQRNTMSLLFFIAVMIGVVTSSFAAGSAYRLSGYSIVGANPRMVFVVTDSLGNGARGININLTSTAGTLDVVSGTTGPDGTLTVNQTGGVLGDTVTATCVSVSVGSPYTIITGTTREVAAADTVITWYDGSQRLLNTAVLVTANKVLTSTSSFSFAPVDNTGDNRNITVSRQTASQTAAGPAQVELLLGTFNALDGVNVDETTVTGNPNGSVIFASNPPTRYLSAFAVDGVSPTVCAVVTDAKGVGISGVSVNVTCTVGNFSPDSGVTNVNGVVYFYELNGTLGNTITVSCPALPETSPATVITSSSVAQVAGDQLITWFERKTRKIQAAFVNRTTHVLDTPVLGSSVNYITVIDVNSNYIVPSMSTFTNQDSLRRPAISHVAFGTSEVGDLLRFRQSLQSRYPANADNYHAILEIPASESQYLMAFATGGANPTVWAVVTDSLGNAVRNVQVNFALEGTGTLDTLTTNTSWSGIALSNLTGAASVGDTITVSATGLGVVNVITANSVAVTATDRTYGWYDPETHKVFGAVVNTLNNILTSSGTTLTAGVLNKTPGNNNPQISPFFAQTTVSPCLSHISFGTIEAGDYIRLNQTITSENYDVMIIANADPAKFLWAFSMGGANSDVWAVVVDNKYNAMENEPVTFSATQGTMDVASANTSYGGFVISTQSGGAIGNTITVSAPGLPPVNVIVSTAIPCVSGDWSYAWYDPSRLTIFGMIVSQGTNVCTSNGSASIMGVYDNTNNNRPFNVNGGLGQDLNRYRGTMQLAHWNIAQGTATVGDEVGLDLSTSSWPDAFVHINSVKTSYLFAYATADANPTVTAMVVDADGVGIPGVSVSFASSSGTIMSNGPLWTTKFDGTVDSTQSKGNTKNIITVSASGYAPVQIYTCTSGGIQAYSPTRIWYSPQNRRLNAVVLQYPCYNVAVTTAPSISFVSVDNTPTNYRTLSATGIKLLSSQLPTYSWVAPGTSGAGDQVKVETTVSQATEDAVFTLPADANQYLGVFATGGSNASVWAVVTDANGNGISGVPVRFQTSNGTMSLSTTVTDASGATISAFTPTIPASLGNLISVSADGVGDTKTVTTATDGPMEPSSIAVPWYNVPARIGNAAFVTIPNNVLAQSTSNAFSPIDTTSNGRTFALGAGVQQTGTDPANVPVTNGYQGQGDIIQAAEDNATANPDAILSINVPNSEITSSISLVPDPVINGNTLTVTMNVFNNGTPAALNVSPTALAVAGGAVYVSGPAPAMVASLADGSSQNFTWTYRATAPGGVTLTGQAIGVDSYTMLGLTSTSTNSNPILVRNPLPPVIVSAIGVTPSAVLTYQSVTVTMTVTNNSSTDVANPVTVTPSALTVTGPAVWALGPTPATWYIPRGEARDFTWVYNTSTFGSVSLTGQAFTTDPFNMAGVTSTATDSNVVTVLDTQVPYIVPTLSASPAVRTVGQTFNLVMSVANNSSMEVPNALTVTPSALTISGPATIASGPTPATQLIARGGSQDFAWVLNTTGPGSVTVTARAYTVNPFDYSGVTSTAASSNLVLAQTPPDLVSTFLVPLSVQRLTTFTVSLDVRNQGQALALSVTPVNLTLTGTGTATLVSGPTPALQNIASGETKTYAWQYKAGAANGSLQFAAQAQGTDQNTGGSVQSPACSSNVIDLVQGLLNLDTLSVSAPRVYRGQKGLQVTLQARNTSVTSVTLTAANLTFNNTQAGFTASPDASNPLLLLPQSAFTLRFNVDVGKDAPLGAVVVNASVVGDAGQAGTLSADGAQQTASWEVLEAFNQLLQNYPNPLKLSQNAFTTFDYYVKEDVKVSMKIYNMAGELVAVLVDGQPGVGQHRAVWYGKNNDIGQRGMQVGSGVYVVVFQSGDYKEMKKVVVIR
jgi:hypothetical protein